MTAEIMYNFQSGPFWDWRVALDLFVGGAGVGALLFAVLLDEAFKGKYSRICHTAAWLSPFLILAGLVLVMLKLGRPLHLFLAYTCFNPTAPLWWGGIFQPLLVIGAFIYAVRWNKSNMRDTFRTRLGRTLVPIALIIGVYHGLLLSVMVARPLWATGPTVVAALLGVVSTGIAIVMLIHLLMMKGAGRLVENEHLVSFLENMQGVRNLLVTVLLLQLLTYFLWWLGLLLGGQQGQQALTTANASFGPMFWFGGIGIGILLPLVLGALTVLRTESNNHKFQLMMIGLTSLLILAGGYCFRLALLLGGQVDLPLNLTF